LVHKRTSALHNGMSALPPKADMCCATRDVRFKPKADICTAPVHVRFTPKSEHRALSFKRQLGPRAGVLLTSAQPEPIKSREVTNDSFIGGTKEDGHVVPAARGSGVRRRSRRHDGDDDRRPHLNHVPTMAGGVGREAVRTFYRDHLVGKFFPPDVKMTNISRTVGLDQVVDEIAISFTHTAPIDWLLPGVPSTDKRVEMVVAVIVGFKDGKISHEHIYWDQASVLVQIGLLNPADLPVGGAEIARKVVNPKLPSRRISSA